jgi:hypothetical protein
MTWFECFDKVSKAAPADLKDAYHYVRTCVEVWRFHLCTLALGGVHHNTMLGP